ncbi:winged helix DNA-binding domain-containing protein [Actinophytocola sediminis]
MTVLSVRALNRATLARQLLIERAELSALDALGHLVGMQAQAPFPPYYGLWTRLVDFDPVELADALVDRRAVRLALMRGTVHLVTAADACALRPLVQPIMDRGLRTNTQHAPALAGLDHTDLTEAVLAVLARGPHTAKELGAALALRWPDRPATALAHAARGLLPLVQVPPRAVWGRSGQTAYQTAQDWLGRPLDPAPDPGALVCRYLAAFGPAAVADIQVWSGLTRLREVVDRLDLRVFTDEQGRDLYDLPEAPRPEADLPVPVRFLPEFDNVLLSYADRSRMMSEDLRKRLFGVPNGVFPATFLVDGFLRGGWRISTQRGAATLTITPWAPVSARDRAALVDEGGRLMEFAAPTARTRQVQFADRPE